MTDVFCILHEEMTELDEGNCHTFIEYEDREIGLSNLGICCFPLGFAFCPPPAQTFSGELDELYPSGWAKWCKENQPSQDDLLVSDLQSIELMEDLESM